MSQSHALGEERRVAERIEWSERLTAQHETWLRRELVRASSPAPVSPGPRFSTPQRETVQYDRD
jgi:hypothetical protein